MGGWSRKRPASLHMIHRKINKQLDKNGVYKLRGKKLLINEI